MSQWFKFYGQQYLTDPKMMGLNPAERAVWVTLLSLASCDGNEGGVIKHLTEGRLLALTGADPSRDEWLELEGIVKKLEGLKVIELKDNHIRILNWNKFQESNLTGAERAKRYRERHAKVTGEGDESNARVEENRIDKNRIDKNRIDKNPPTPLENIKTLKTFNKKLTDKFSIKK